MEYVTFLFSEERTICSTPKSWTSTENGKDYCWYPTLFEAVNIKQIIKTAVEPEQDSGKWTKLEGTIVDDAVYQYKDNDTQISKYINNQVLESDFNDGNDELIQDLPMIETSQRVRDILAHRLKTRNEQKDIKTPRDKENMKMLTNLVLGYNEAKPSGLKIKVDLLTGVGDLSQQKRKNKGGL